MDRTGKNIDPSSSENLVLSETAYPVKPLFEELIGTVPQTQANFEELNNFLDWFTKIVSSELHENEDLCFKGNRIKAGLILVGKDKTWIEHGVSPYLKWAEYYSSARIDMLLITGRGEKGFVRATEVKNALISKRGYEQLNFTSSIQCVSPSGINIPMTCYVLKLYKEIIKCQAWDKLEELYNQSLKVNAVIERVNNDFLSVNVFKSIFEVNKDHFSEMKILHAHTLFSPGQELILNILEINKAEKKITLSNKGTSSDPKVLIDDMLAQGKTYNCLVKSIKIDKNGNEAGLYVKAEEFSSWIFVPRINAIIKKSLKLSDIYSPSQEVKVRIDYFSETHTCFIGYIEQEKTLQKEKEHTAGKNIQEPVQIEALPPNKPVRPTVKRISPAGIKSKWYEKHSGDSVIAEITEINPGKGLTIKLDGIPLNGFIPNMEIAWGPVGRIDNLFSIGEKINALVYAFKEKTGQIIFSLKRGYKHEFENWLPRFTLYKEVTGKIVNHYDQSVQVEVEDEGYTIQAFVLRGSISMKTKILKEDVEHYLPVGEYFHFIIVGVNEQLNTVEVSRKRYLQLFEDPEYGEAFSVFLTKYQGNRLYFYADDIEGWVKKPAFTLAVGQKINVMPVSLSLAEFVIV